MSYLYRGTLPSTRAGRPEMANVIRNETALEQAQKLALEFAKASSERDQQRRLPYQEVQKLAESGLLGITVPQAYGGLFVSNVTLGRVIKTLSAGDSSIGQIPQGHFYTVEAIRHAGTEEQKRYFFSLALDGYLFGNAFAETGTKSVAECKTRITHSASGYVINGRKFYSTGALFAQWIAVVGLNEDDKLLLALVKRDAAGLTVVDDWSGMGQRTTASGTALFENVEVSERDVFPHYLAFEQPTTQVVNSTMLHAAIDIGIADAAVKDAIQFVHNHSRPWIESGVQYACQDPFIIHEIGEMMLQLHAAEAMLTRAGEFCDLATEDMSESRIAEASVAVAEAIALAEKAALFTTNKLFEVSGTKSTLNQFNHDRHWRNARTHTLHDPVQWKYYRIGNYYLNGVDPPRNR